MSRFGVEDEALAMANDVEYGLAGSVWNSDVGRDAIRERAQFGCVWINDHLVLGPEMPVGGFRSFGYGIEGGMAGVDEFTAVKQIIINSR